MDKVLASIALRSKKAADEEGTEATKPPPAPAAAPALPPRNALLAAIASRGGGSESESSTTKTAEAGPPPRSALFSAITARNTNTESSSAGTTTSAPPTTGAATPTDKSKAEPVKTAASGASTAGATGKKKKAEKEKGGIDLFPEDVKGAFNMFSRHTDTITAEDLNEAYHNQYHTVKGINEDNLQKALNQFCEELLPPSKKGGKKEIEEIDLATFMKGIEKANLLLEEADDKEDFIHELEQICLDLANNDPGQFAELLGLSPALLVGDVRSLMDAMQSTN